MSTFTPRSASLEWASLFAAEWTRLAGGRADEEFLIDQGLTLVRVVGDQPAAEMARKHFENTPEPEQLVRDFEADVTELAAALGLIGSGERLDAAHLDFAHGVAALCAAEEHGHGDPAGGIEAHPHRPTGRANPAEG